ncbi:MAG TPA: DUF4383 domain-containing protein [Candidatus Limnocylindria bacterium]|nr:DUF4383 domain-containing protein [Candidatus Limnocylindria bacterium]
MTQKITLALGVFYVAIGILGFVPGITSNGLLLGIFAVNAIHNIAHLAVGAALVWGGMSPGSTTAVNKAMTIVFAVLVIGSFIAPIVEQVPLNPPDTVLHLVSGAITAYLGFMARPAMVTSA